MGQQLHKEYCDAPWQGLSGAVRAPAVQQRKLAAYNAWWRAREGEQQPPYLRAELRKRARLIARFRTGGCSALGVEQGRRQRPRVRWEDRTCTRCSPEHLEGLACGVDDEWHLVFECQCTQQLRGQEEFRSLLAEAGDDFRKFTKGESAGKFILIAMGILEGERDHAVVNS